MPSPGAVCPAIVTLPFLIDKLLFNVIVPDTSKTIIRAPVALIASRKLPAPASLRFVTFITLPPLPPVALRPKPSAPGNE
jgi:hypothetical protein